MILLSFFAAGTIPSSFLKTLFHLRPRWPILSTPLTASEVFRISFSSRYIFCVELFFMPPPVVIELHIDVSPDRKAPRGVDDRTALFAKCFLSPSFFFFSCNDLFPFRFASLLYRTFSVYSDGTFLRDTSSSCTRGRCSLPYARNVQAFSPSNLMAPFYTLTGCFSDFRGALSMPPPSLADSQFFYLCLIGNDDLFFCATDAYLSCTRFPLNTWPPRYRRSSFSSRGVIAGPLLRFFLVL